MTSLYQIKDDYRNLLAMELDEQTLADTLESLTDEFDSKAENICFVVKEVEAKAESVDAEIKRLVARKKTFDSRADSLRSYLRDNMESLGFKKIERDLFTLTLVAGRQSVEITDASKVPEQFCKTETVVSVDKRALLEELKKDGAEITGAQLVLGKPSLRIY